MQPLVFEEVELLMRSTDNPWAEGKLQSHSMMNIGGSYS